MTVMQAFDNFIFDRRNRGLSDDSIRAYRNCLTPFMTWLVHDYDITDLSPRMIVDYIAYLICRDISMASKATYIRHLKIFVCWMESAYHLSLDGKFIHVPKTPLKVLRIYTDNEIQQIYNAARGYTGWLTMRNCAMVSLMLDSGLREGEICNLLDKDLHIDQHYVKVTGKGNKERYVPIGNVTVYYLDLYYNLCPHFSDHVFVGYSGNPVTRNAIKHLMYRMASRLPFELSAHKLRHNFATNYCLDAYQQTGQVDIYRLMILMGHEDVKTTRRYLHIANQIITMYTTSSHLDGLVELRKISDNSLFSVTDPNC